MSRRGAGQNEDSQVGVFPVGHRPFLVVVTLAFATLCSVPYLVAALGTPPGAKFSGVLLNPFDQNYYQAAQRSAAEDLPRRNRFTSESGAPGPVALLYPLMGELQAALRVPPVAAYHLPRLLALAAFPTVLWHFFHVCFPRRRRLVEWAVLLALFLTGVLALTPWSFASHSGEQSPESNVLLSFTVFPHFAVSYLGLTLGFTALALALRGRSIGRVAAVAVAAGLLMGVGHTFLLLPVLLVGGVFLVAAVVTASLRPAEVEPVKRLLVAAVAVTACAAPFLLILRNELTGLERLGGTPFPSTVAHSWWTLVLGYGLAVPLAALGLFHLRVERLRDRGAQLVVVWTVVQLALVYSSVTVFQRRFVEGLVVPVAALAAVGLTAPQFRRSARGATAAVVALLMLGSMTMSRAVGQTGQYVEDRYADLWSLVHSTDVVLAGNEVSSMLPAFTSGTVYAARIVETLHSRVKARKRARYAESPTSDGAREWLRRSGITLVVVDDADGSFLPRGLREPGAACLEPVLRRPLLTAYRVQERCPASEVR